MALKLIKNNRWKIWEFLEKIIGKIKSIIIIIGSGLFCIICVDHFLIAQPGAVYLHVSSLPANTEVRIDWLPPPGSNNSTIITSYEVVYSLYEAVKDTRSVRVNNDATSYVIQDLSKHSKH